MESYQKPITVGDLYKLLKAWTQSVKGGRIEVAESVANCTVVANSATVTEDGLRVVFSDAEPEYLYNWEAIKEDTLFFDERDSTFHCKAKIICHNVDLRITAYPFQRRAGWAQLRLFAKNVADLKLAE